MENVQLEATLGVAPEDLWRSVADFGAVSEFLDVVQKSYLVGDSGNQRECLLPDGGKLDETLVSKDHGARKMEYTITGGLPMTNHLSSMEVLDAGDGKSTFRWITEYATAEGAPEGFPEMFGGMLAGEVQKLEQRWP